jgi:hypothetical protein
VISCGKGLQYRYKPPAPLDRIKDPQVIRRFMEKCELREDGLLYWKGTLCPQGYGRFRYRGRFLAAHRIAWAIFVGPVPQDKHLHHTKRCDYARHCVDPEALEPMDPDLNSREANARKNGRIQDEEFDIPI